MIDIKSLRIGNNVYIPKTDQIAYISLISCAGLIGVNNDAIGLSGLTVNELEPIPLTEQILLDLGFEKQGSFLYLDCGIFGICINKGNLICIEDNAKDSIVIGVFNFLHQIQNIVYDLSGKELEFKK